MSLKPTTKLTLTLVHETKEARLYADDKNREQWIPRSVCPRLLVRRTPGATRAVHEVHVEDWWLEQHPFEQLKPKPQDELI